MTGDECDHLAGESMKHQEKYLGRRSPRGLFHSSTGVTINADMNGALGILLKTSNQKSLLTQLRNPSHGACPVVSDFRYAKKPIKY